MTFVIGILTLFLVGNCLLLILLVLIQLPKKEAGVGLAFGGGATDALFGAGSGNVLTRITKYSAGIFFALALLLSWLNTRVHNSANSGAALKNALSKTPAATAPFVPGPAVPAAGSNTMTNLTATLPAGSNTSLTLLSASNAPAASPPMVPATNAPGSK